jgi:hypothetical protein
MYIAVFFFFHSSISTFICSNAFYRVTDDRAPHRDHVVDGYTVVISLKPSAVFPEYWQIRLPKDEADRPIEPFEHDSPSAEWLKYYQAASDELALTPLELKSYLQQHATLGGQFFNSLYSIFYYLLTTPFSPTWSVRIAATAGHSCLVYP